MCVCVSLRWEKGQNGKTRQMKHFHMPVCVLQVILYDGLSRQVRRTFGRFKDTAYSGSIRADGRLLVAGGQNGIVQVG